MSGDGCILLRRHGFAADREWTPLDGCPRCGGAVLRFEYRSCLHCGYAGPTRTPSRADMARTGKERLEKAGRERDAADRVAEIVAMWDQGHSLEAIARALGGEDRKVVSSV